MALSKMQVTCICGIAVVMELQQGHPVQVTKGIGCCYMLLLLLVRLSILQTSVGSCNQVLHCWYVAGLHCNSSWELLSVVVMEQHRHAWCAPRDGLTTAATELLHRVSAAISPSQTNTCNLIQIGISSMPMQGTAFAVIQADASRRGA